jgi:hypothetical protein
LTKAIFSDLIEPDRDHLMREVSHRTDIPIKSLHA